jgi:hypothetical protein
MGAWTGGVVSDRAVDRLKAAGQAIGLKRVTFESLRSYYMLHGTRFMPSLMPPAQPATERIGDPCGPSPADRTRAALEVELGKLTPKRSKVVRFLINKGESGATGAVIISATGVPGFRQMLVTLAETSSYWNLRIRFPPDGRTNYVINIF